MERLQLCDHISNTLTMWLQGEGELKWGRRDRVVTFDFFPNFHMLFYITEHLLIYILHSTLPYFRLLPIHYIFFLFFFLSAVYTLWGRGLVCGVNRARVFPVMDLRSWLTLLATYTPTVRPSVDNNNLFLNSNHVCIFKESFKPSPHCLSFTTLSPSSSHETNHSGFVSVHLPSKL